MAGMLFAAANDLTLSDTQKASLATLSAQLGPSDAARTAMTSLNGDLVAGVKAGKLDTAKLTTDAAAVDTAQQAQQAAQATAINGLYALLDAGQRKQLVDGVRAKQTARDARRPPPPTAPSASASAAASAAGVPANWAKQRVDRLTATLGLDAGQQTQVTALLAKQPPPTPAAMQANRDAMKKRMDALLTGFAGDGFDATKLDWSTPAGMSAKDNVQKRIDYYTGLIAILKPDQLQKLATSMTAPLAAAGRVGPNAGALDPTLGGWLDPSAGGDDGDNSDNGDGSNQ
jgi:Spy/CpxP family protein refolding chaperone